MKYFKNVYCVRQSQRRSGHVSKPQKNKLINILACGWLFYCNTITCQKYFWCSSFSRLMVKEQQNNNITVKLTKPWTPEIFMECYCVVRNQPIRRVITKLQTATVISLWFWGLLAHPELYCNWPVPNQHSWNFSEFGGNLKPVHAKHILISTAITCFEALFLLCL